MDNQSLFGDLDDFTIWKEHWKGMPEFIQEDLDPYTIDVTFGDYFDNKGTLVRNRVIKVHFETIEDIFNFANLVGIKGITQETKYLRIEDIEEFTKLMEQTITDKTKFIWYPKQDALKPRHYLYVDES